MAIYRKPTARSPRPETAADEEDTFVAATLHAANWARRNTTVLVLGLVVVVVSVASLLYYRSYRSALRSDAAARLESLQQRIGAAGQDGVRGDLELFLERYGSTPAAGEARITLAQVLAEAGEHEAAAQVLEPIAGDARAPLGAQAAALLAALFEDMGNVQGAEALYMRLADDAQLGFQARDALAAAARLRAARDDHAGALELYDRLLESPGDLGPDRSLMEMRRAEVAATLR